MSSSKNAGPSHHVFYTACNTCNLVLAVSAPGSSLTETVAIRCELCGTKWTVNLAAAFQSSQDCENYPSESTGSSCLVPYNWTGTQAATSRERAVNPTLEKRLPTSTAYNQFVKLEIQRIKASNPYISHKEAFGTAAKNWALLPRILSGIMSKGKDQPMPDGASTDKRTGKRPQTNQ